MAEKKTVNKTGMEDYANLVLDLMNRKEQLRRNPPSNQELCDYYTNQFGSTVSSSTIGKACAQAGVPLRKGIGSRGGVSRLDILEERVAELEEKVAKLQGGEDLSLVG